MTSGIKKRDWTNFWIIGFFIVLPLCLIVFAVTMEVLKFVALVKWIFS